jgi:feruloyl esterase
MASTGRSTGRIVITLAAVLVALRAGVPPAVAAETDDACAALAGLSFADLPDAPTTISSAQVVPAGADLPAHCRVQGFVAPQVRFEIRLPEDWNGKLLHQGCGGLCGAVQPATCDDALARRYAVVVTDMGHEGKPWESAWARNNLPAEIDFAYRATHVVTVAAKAITASHYGKPASRAYFRGCSTGGRQGLIEAQQFPADFDGIIVGAPVLDETGVAAFHLMWSGQANLDAGGRQLLTPVHVELLRAAVLAACDALDGQRDGLLEDPRRCIFDPAALACARNIAADDCLTVAQQSAVRKLYDGARNSRGESLFAGGLSRGSEYEWVPNFVGRDGPAVFDPGGGPVRELYQNLLFMPDPDPDPAPEAANPVFDFDVDPPRLALMERLYSAQNPDLSAFRARGGKLILYHGWDDAEIPPALMTRYFSRVRQAMGGAKATSDFARLFMLPGVAHCRRGPGADTADWLHYLERWVEQGHAPDSIAAHHLVAEQNYLGLPRPRFPLRVADYDRVKTIKPFRD